MVGSQARQQTRSALADTPSSRSWGGWAVLLLILTLFSITCLYQPTSNQGFWIARVSVISALLLAAYVKPQDGALPFDPPYFMAAVVLILYVLGPALLTEFALGGSIEIAPGEWADSIRKPGTNISLEATRRAMGSHAEWLILRFVLLCLALSSLLSLWKHRTIPPKPGKSLSWQPPLAIGVAVALLNLGRHTPWYAAMPSSGVDQVFAILPAIVCCCLACLLIAWWQQQRCAMVSFLVLAPLAAISFLPFSIKALGWALVVDLMIIALLLRGRARVSALVLLGFLPAIFMVVMAASRPAVTQLNSARWVIHQMVQKIVYRQAETVYCFVFVDKKHSKTLFSVSGSSYFLSGLVPKIIWKDKPSLSNGDVYARDFCGWPEREIANSHHSASITLLGEPLIKAGPGGLVTAQVVIMVVLTAITVAMRSGRAILLTSALAVIPWVIDFDQHFALWLANIVKFVLVALATSTILFLFSRSNTHKP